MKRALPLLALSLAAAAFAGTATVVYHASKKSNVYHLPGCASAKAISKDNLITFASKEEAQKKDYRPCAVCKP